MFNNMIIAFTVRTAKGVGIDSFTTQQWGDEDTALDKARACRDKYNASELVQKTGEPAKIYRSRRRDTAKWL